MKMVWYYQAARGKPEKRKIISRRRGYHGVTMAAASMTALAYAQNGFGLPLDFVKHTTTRITTTRAATAKRSRIYRTLCRRARSTDHRGRSRDRRRPVRRTGHGRRRRDHSAGRLFRRHREVLERHDVLLVADEVICGFGRTGEMWGSQTMDVRPDMLTCAKALSSAYLPISAVLMSDRVMTRSPDRQSRSASLAMAIPIRRIRYARP